MGTGEAAAMIDEILRADLGELAAHGRASVLPSTAIGRWGLPEFGVHELELYGLPAAREDGLIGVVAAFQESTTPCLEGGLFEIGAYGVAKLGLSALDGSVRSISPCGHSDVHPQLAALRANDVPVRLVNSILVNFIEFSWRWDRLLPVLAERQVAAGDDEVRAWSGARTDAERAGLPDFYADVRSFCGTILSEFEAADPQALQGEGAFWRMVVMEYL